MKNDLGFEIMLYKGHKKIVLFTLGCSLENGNHASKRFYFSCALLKMEQFLCTQLPIETTYSRSFNHFFNRKQSKIKLLVLLTKTL